MNRKRKALFLPLCIPALSAGLTLPITATAQSKELNVLEEVLVTATKRGTVALADTPIAIQVFSNEDLQRQGIKQFADYAPQISGLSFEDQGPGDKRIVIRGLQSVGASTTGVYFDDIILTGNNRQDGGGRQADLRLADMERIEVLKGPQGTLYGASSMSGTIRLITNKPDVEAMSGGINATVSTTEEAGDENTDIDGMINIPIIKGVAALRLVAYQSDQSGFVDNIHSGPDGAFNGQDDVNNIDISGGRAAFRWMPTERVTLDMMYLEQDTESDGPYWYQPIFGEYNQRNLTPAPWKESVEAFNIALEWELDHGTISASTSGLDRDIFYSFPATRVLCSIFGKPKSVCFSENDPELYATQGTLNQPQDRSIDNSEIRYASNWNGPLQLVAGLFYQKEESSFTSTVSRTTLAGDALTDQQNIFVNRQVNGEIENTAAFGELSYDFSERLTGTVGVRVFEFEINEVGQNLATTFRENDAAPVPTSSQEDDINWKFNLSYDISEDAMVYANYAEGFRAGGNNEPDFTSGATFPAFGSDSLESWEVGGKASFLDRRLQVDAALYFMEWSDRQERVLASLDEGDFLIIDNVGSAEIMGFELGIVALPFANLDLSVGGNITVMEAELSEDPPQLNASSPQEGDRIPFVPEFSASAFIEHMAELSGAWSLISRADYSYVGKSYTDFRPASPRYEPVGDYSLVNARLIFDYDNRYQVTLFGDNLLDESAIITEIIDGTLRRPNMAIPVRPRTVGVSVSYQF
ncbi:MAG: iron complex outermembrane receptor protein [Halioglobus sp.]|jgi:iron complex outermembrane receptor protein